MFTFPVPGNSISIFKVHSKATLGLRPFHPEVKEGLRAVAEKERRSLANMIEVMIRDYCSRAGVALEEETTTR